MSQSVAIEDVEESTDLKPERRTREQSRSKPKRQPPYAVILHNDDYNGMDYVVGVLKKVFGYGTSKSIWLMLRTHATGQTQVWSGALEVAELKADQLRSCGADPNMRQQGAQPLRVSLEPLE
jgi:ATP-dependent Clp protease adaptor protein ClpS